jgi:hypothetical protein
MCNTKCDINDPSKTAPAARAFKNAWFSRFAAKHEIPDHSLLEAVRRAEDGLIDADLGNGLIKQRIARASAGKSKGFRSIVVFRDSERAFFIYGFAKNETGNLKPNELAQYRKAAKLLLALTEIELNALLTNGTFEEIKTNEQKVPLKSTGRPS